MRRCAHKRSQAPASVRKRPAVEKVVILLPCTRVCPLVCCLNFSLLCLQACLLPACDCLLACFLAQRVLLLVGLNGWLIKLASEGAAKRRQGRHAHRQASKPASQPDSQQASERASERASKPPTANKQITQPATQANAGRQTDRQTNGHATDN